MKYVRTNKRRKGASREAIIRQRVETAKAPVGAPWIRLPDGSKGNAVDQWAWNKFKESGYKEYPSEIERMVAVDNGTVGRFIEAQGETSIVEKKIVCLGFNDKEVEIDCPIETEQPKRGEDWKKEGEALKKLMEKAQEQRDHEQAILHIIKENLPATPENYEKVRAKIKHERKVANILNDFRKEK